MIKAKHVIMDMDGVIVRGSQSIPGAPEFIRKLNDDNRKFLILTNNSIYTPRDLANRLHYIGIDVSEAVLNPMLFPFQRHIVRWALKKGRAALFADCGLGKSPMQLEWAQRVHEHTGKPVLILAPLAVPIVDLPRAHQAA